jgi:hypothetical protein
VKGVKFNEIKVERKSSNFYFYLDLAVSPEELFNAPFRTTKLAPVTEKEENSVIYFYFVLVIKLFLKILLHVLY